MAGILSSLTTRAAFARQLRTDASTFLTTVSADAVIATVSDPFAGQGRGTTTYTTFGTVPAQLRLSGNKIVATGTAAVAGTLYAIGIRATSGDGKRILGDTYSYAAIAAGTSTPAPVAGVAQVLPNPIPVLAAPITLASTDTSTALRSVGTPAHYVEFSIPSGSMGYKFLGGVNAAGTSGYGVQSKNSDHFGVYYFLDGVEYQTTNVYAGYTPNPNTTYRIEYYEAKETTDTVLKFFDKADPNNPLTTMKFSQISGYPNIGTDAILRVINPDDRSNIKIQWSYSGTPKPVISYGQLAGDTTPIFVRTNSFDANNYANFSIKYNGTAYSYGIEIRREDQSVVSFAPVKVLSNTTKGLATIRATNKVTDSDTYLYVICEIDSQGQKVGSTVTTKMVLPPPPTVGENVTSFRSYGLTHPFTNMLKYTGIQDDADGYNGKNMMKNPEIFLSDGTCTKSSCFYHFTAHHGDVDYELTWDGGDANPDIRILEGVTTILSKQKVSNNKYTFRLRTDRTSNSPLALYGIYLRPDTTVGTAAMAKNFILCRAGDDKTQKWNPEYIARKRALGGYLRQMDNMCVNTVTDQASGEIGWAEKTWAQRPVPTIIGPQPLGTSAEDMIEMSNILNRSPWFCIPISWIYDDNRNSLINFIKGVFTGEGMVGGVKINNNLKVIIEMGNENWDSQRTRYHYFAGKCIESGRGTAAEGQGNGNSVLFQRERVWAHKEMVILIKSLVPDWATRIQFNWGAQFAPQEFKNSTNTRYWPDCKDHINRVAYAPYNPLDPNINKDNPKGPVDYADETITAWFDASLQTVVAPRLSELRGEANGFGYAVDIYEHNQAYPALPAPRWVSRRHRNSKSYNDWLKAVYCPTIISQGGNSCIYSGDGYPDGWSVYEGEHYGAANAPWYTLAQYSIDQKLGNETNGLGPVYTQAVPTLGSGIDLGSELTLSADKLTVTRASGGSAANRKFVRSSVTLYNAYYVEMKCVSGTGFGIGVDQIIGSLNRTTPFGTDSQSFFWQQDGKTFYNDTAVVAAGLTGGFAVAPSVAPTFAAGDVLGLAVDVGQRRIWIAKNGVWINGNPSTLTGGVAVQFSPGRPVFEVGVGSVATVNFGQQAYTYAAPTGFGDGYTLGKNYPDNPRKGRQLFTVTGPATVAEGAGNVSYTITRSDATGAEGRVKWTAGPRGADSEKASVAQFGGTWAGGTIVFAPNETTKTVTVTVGQDGVNTGTKQFYVGITEMLPYGENVNLDCVITNVTV